jgi:hypothetical protein
MKIISAIYLHCKTGLRDDWISKLNADQDVEEGKVSITKKKKKKKHVLSKILTKHKYRSKRNI